MHVMCELCPVVGWHSTDTPISCTFYLDKGLDDVLFLGHILFVLPGIQTYELCVVSAMLYLLYYWISILKLIA